MSCIGCNQAVTQQKANDENIINIAQQKANEQKRAVALYRNELGELCIASGGESIIMLITPKL